MREHTGEVFQKTALTGGDINDVYKIEAAQGVFALKENKNPPPDLFAREAMGLTKLAEAGLPVPKVYFYSEKCLLLEYLAPGPSKPQEAGKALGELHAQTKGFFGLDEDNYIGKLPQKNSPHKDWIHFFWERRIHDQLKLLPSKDQDIWNRLKDRLPELIPPCKPSLIHGDLWSGNLYWSEKGPYFIDPAIYQADPMIELAFTELFGSFGKAFYDSYSRVKPIPKEYTQLRTLYQIYPLLVHANHFGGGYYASALRNAQSYL